MKYTQVPADTFEKLQLNAGIIVDSFDPATGELGNILGATSGGVSWNTNPTFSDFGEDIDNVPANTMELKRLEGYDPVMSGTLKTVTAQTIKTLQGAADISLSESSRVIPRSELLTTDFKTICWVGDYSDVNNGENAGFLYILCKRSLNTTGFQIQSGKNAKADMPFEFHGHYTISDTDDIPFEYYCKAGTAPTTTETTPSNETTTP